MISEWIVECFTQEAPQNNLLLYLCFLNNLLAINPLYLTALNFSLADGVLLQENEAAHQQNCRLRIPEKAGR